MAHTIIKTPFSYYIVDLIISLKFSAKVQLYFDIVLYYVKNITFALNFKAKYKIQIYDFRKDRPTS